MADKPPVIDKLPAGDKPMVIAAITKARRGVSGQFFSLGYDGPVKRFDGTAIKMAKNTQRKAMFEARKAAVEDEMKQLEKTLDMLKFKCWYYEQAIKDGSEDRLKSLIPDRLPEKIRKAYENAHR